MKRYSQITEVLEKRINMGRYAPGSKLPSIKEFSDEFSINHLTVRKALQELQSREIVEICHGVGTFVSKTGEATPATTTNIALACRSFMIDNAVSHPILGAVMSEVYRHCPAPEYMIQPIFFKKHSFTQDCSAAILANKISGVLVLGGGLTEEDLEFLKENRIPAVEIDPHDLEMHKQWGMSIGWNKKKALTQAIDHLRLFGHKQIAIIGYKYSPYDAVKDFTELAYRYRLGNPDKLIMKIDNPEGKTVDWEQVDRFFSMEEKPTAVITGDDHLADIILEGCDARQIRVTDDLSVLSLQDANPNGHRIPLTAVKLPEDIKDITGGATAMLVDCINGDAVKNPNVMIDIDIKTKASTGPAPNNGK